AHTECISLFVRGKRVNPRTLQGACGHPGAACGRFHTNRELSTFGGESHEQLRVTRKAPNRVATRSTFDRFAEEFGVREHVHVGEDVVGLLVLAPESDFSQLLDGWILVAALPASG